jgi:hypothetical protein
MNPKNNIRVIKSAQRKNQAEMAKTEKPGSQSLRDATREIAGNVAAWVKDFQGRRRPDPRRSFANLFIDPASNLKSAS